MLHTLYIYRITLDLSMKRILVLFFVFIIPFMLTAQQNTINIMPQPVSVLPQTGSFHFANNILISAPTSTEVQYVTDYLTHKLHTATGYPVTISAPGSNAAIQLVLNKNSDTALGKEGYKLSVTPNSIVIHANQPAGLFYGVQTLMQLLPKEIESDTTVQNMNWSA